MSGYNWWVTKESGLWPIVALVKLGQKLGCNFDVRFDSGAFEQAWAIQEGLTPIPEKP